MDLRRQKRFPVNLHSVLTVGKGKESSGTILDLSKKGCLIATALQVYAGMPITLRIETLGTVAPIHVEKAAVRWKRGEKIGVGIIMVAPADQERFDQLLKSLNQDQQ